MSDKNFQLRKLNQKLEAAKKIKDFEQMVFCYEKMFEITNDYHFKQQVANIQYKIYNNIQKAAEIYEEVVPHLKNESYFWWQYFEIKANLHKTYDAVSCIYNAVKIEMKGMKK